MPVTANVRDVKPIPRWMIGPRIWRVDGEWRLRLYRPWRPERLVEAQSESFLAALVVLIQGAGVDTR